MVTATDIETADAIEIENIGPVERLRIPLPRGGGVVVLTGDNGAGKSESLSAVRALAGSSVDKKDLRPRDGEKSGLIEGCGVTIKVGRANRESGDLAVNSLEDKLDIKQLVDPDILDQNAADRTRLKSLIRVSGVHADLSLFDKLLGPTFELDSKVIKETDLIAMAAGVKRALEAKARSEETASEASGVEAATCLKSVEGIDIDAESDDAVLQANYRGAVKVLSDLEGQVKASKAAADAAETARGAIQRTKAKYDGPSKAEADLQLQEARQTVATCQDAVAELESQLRQARTNLAQAVENEKHFDFVADAAYQHFNTIAEWEAQLAQAIPEMPSDDLLAEAKSEVEAATRMLQQGQVVRNAKAKHAEAQEWTRKKRERAKQAEHWREAAKGVDEVLSEVVQNLGCPIFVGEDDKGLRLMINHPRRGTTFFSELSEGEKWKVVIPLAIKMVGPGGMFVVPQEAWEGLQPRVRRQIIRDVLGSGVWCITAQSADGELHAEVAS